MLYSLPPVAFLLAASWRDRLDKALFDDTFDGIHSLNWFDYSLLIPYFTLMLILAFYGAHRYKMMWAYYKSRRNRGIALPPPQPFAQLPRVNAALASVYISKSLPETPVRCDATVS